MALANKFILGDIVEHTISNGRYRITWIDHDDERAGIVRVEKEYGHWEGKEVPLAELKLIKPSIHIDRPLKPVSEMTEDELREHVRLLREGRQEALSSSKSKTSKKKSKSTKKKKKKASKLTKLKKKYPDQSDEVLETVADMGEDWAEKFIPNFTKKE